MIVSMTLFVAGAVTARAAEAKENWGKYCAKCHGPDGKGKTKMGEKFGIKDYSDPKIQEGIKDEEMAKAIKDGKGKMKGYGENLNDDEIKALVKYVRGLKK